MTPGRGLLLKIGHFQPRFRRFSISFFWCVSSFQALMYRHKSPFSNTTQTYGQLLDTSWIMTGRWISARKKQVRFPPGNGVLYEQWKLAKWSNLFVLSVMLAFEIVYDTQNTIWGSVKNKYFFSHKTFVVWDEKAMFFSKFFLPLKS